MRFLLAVSQLVSSAQRCGQQNAAFAQQVAAFSSELEDLAASIFPAPALSTGSQRAEWTSSVHGSLHQLQGLDRETRYSVVSLVHVMAASLLHLLHAPLLSCLLHALFHLDHRPNCTRPRRHHGHAQGSHGQGRRGSDHEDEEQVVAAVGHYFFTRFPPLLISVYHLAQRRWADHPSLKAFFHGGDRL